jgi:hypothetical protein
VSIAVPAPIPERVARIAQSLGENLESVVYYEHPLSVRGVVVVLGEATAPYLDSVARVQGMLSPVRLHCLRARELFQLALPGFSAPPSLDDQPHLAHCVKYRSVLLHGRDCRPEVPLPARPDLFLGAHLRGCRHYMRVHNLKQLLNREHRRLVGEIAEETRRLLSTALVDGGGWQVALADVTERFAAERPGEAASVAQHIAALQGRLPADPEADPREEAWEAAWLFERLLVLLDALTVPSARKEEAS